MARSMRTVGGKERARAISYAGDGQGTSGLKAGIDQPTKTLPPSGRILWVDYVKGLSIIAIVVIHNLRGMTRSGIVDRLAVIGVLGDWIESWSMPLFFVMSGIFLTGMVQRSLRDCAENRFRSIVYPYLLWSSVYMVVASLAGGLVNGERSLIDGWRILYEPQAQYWFLYAMLISSTLFLLLRKAGLSDRNVLLISIALFILNPFVFEDGMKIYSRSLFYLPFLSLGALMGREGPVRKFDVATDRTLIAIAIGGAVALWFVVREVGDPTVNPFWSPLLFLLGGAATLSTASLLKRHNALRFIEQCGFHTLEIYLTHNFCYVAVRILLVRLLGIENFVVVLTAGVVVGLAVPMFVSILASKAGFPYLFTLHPRKVLPVSA